MNNSTLVNIHILISTVLFGVLCITALQALVLAIQEHVLHHKHGVKAIAFLPPLERMEKVLFQMLAIGFILLTLIFLTSLWSFYPIWFSSLWQKTLASLIAWLIFAALLIGRHMMGWRGRRAIRWALAGVSLVMIIFLGSEFL